jgi:ABC-type transport system substrate-binding protein
LAAAAALLFAARKVDMCFLSIFAPPGLPHLILDVIFHGRGIQPTANFNWSQLDDARINAALDAAAVTVDPEERAAAYGAADRRIVATAAAVPLAWTTVPGIRSPDVAGPMGPGGWDPAFLSVK